MVRHVAWWSCPARSRCRAKQDMTGSRAKNSGPTIIQDMTRAYRWPGHVRHLCSPSYWTMLCNFSLSYNPPILGGKTWEENGARGPPTFPLPFSFLSHFLPIQARENTSPHPIFLSHLLSSPIFPPSKHTLTAFLQIQIHIFILIFTFTYSFKVIK